MPGVRRTLLAMPFAMAKQPCQKFHSKPCWQVNDDTSLQEKLEADVEADAVVVVAKDAELMISTDD